MYFCIRESKEIFVLANGIRNNKIEIVNVRRGGIKIFIYVLWRRLIIPKRIDIATRKIVEIIIDLLFLVIESSFGALVLPNFKSKI